MLNSILLAFSPGPFEIILVLVIVLLLFGGKKIPELMKGMGKGIRNFKDGLNTDEGEEEDKDQSKNTKDGNKVEDDNK
ncbi:MAG: twin-arginine translocase TatA/TatE family subunit [Bacteroidales bacterium]|nr:twin-arginine translocase TatA/TatE family subunit [Bacteroidales bacterium]